MILLGRRSTAVFRRWGKGAISDSIAGNRTEQNGGRNNDTMALDKNMLEVFGGIFESQQAAEEFMKIVDGTPKRFMEELCLQGDFIGHIEIRFFEKKTNRAEELFKDFPYGQKIIKVLKDKFADKLKRRVNTAIVLYDFDWAGHFSNHFLSQMREKKTDKYHIFRIENVYPYK